MDRRSFLASLAAAVTGSLALDPEKLLWLPGKKLISIPKTASIPAVATTCNRLLTSQQITWETLEIMDSYLKTIPVLKIGDTIHVRRPQRWKPNQHGLSEKFDLATRVG